MIILTLAVLSVLYACVLYFCICTCSAQLSMFHMDRRSRNTLIIITIIWKQCNEMVVFWRWPWTSRSAVEYECLLYQLKSKWIWTSVQYWCMLLIETENICMSFWPISHVSVFGYQWISHWLSPLCCNTVVTCCFVCVCLCVLVCVCACMYLHIRLYVCVHALILHFTSSFHSVWLSFLLPFFIHL